MISSNMAFVPADQSMFPNHQALHSPSTSPNALPSCAPHQHFHGVSLQLMRRSMSFSGVNRHDEVQVDDDMSDDGSQLGEKKKRLNLEQVKALEKSFELGNKLEPERKMQLTRALGLQPRQIAIWFQNRRARWKTKQLEKEYEILKMQFENLKADNDALKTRNKELQAELLALKGGESTGARPINLTMKIEGSWSNVSENNGNASVSATRTLSTDSQMYSQMSNKHLYPSSISATSLTQLLQSSSRSDFQYQKIDQSVADESFCNMFSGIDDQPGFWPWPEQQHFH